jgi:hypothetical protein
MSSSSPSPRSPSAAARSTTTSASYRQYTRAGSSSSATENLPPRTLARVAREVRDLHKNPPENVRLVVDPATGMPNNLGELMVRTVSLLLLVIVALVMMDRSQTEQTEKEKSILSLTTAPGGALTLRCSEKPTVLTVHLSNRIQLGTPLRIQLPLSAK